MREKYNASRDVISAEFAIQGPSEHEALGGDFQLAVGDELFGLFGGGKFSDDDLEKVIMDSDRRSEALKWLVGHGIVGVHENKHGERKYKIKLKAYGALKTGRLEAAKTLARGMEGAGENIEDIDAAYGRHDEARLVKGVSLAVDKDSCQILPINELRIGHQDSRAGHKLVREYIERLREQAPDDRPDVILVSNLIQGDFSHSKSKKRAALAVGLDSNDAQFREAKIMLDDVKSLGKPVVLNLGSDDLRIAEDYTKDVVMEIEGLLKDGSESNFIPYYQQNKLTQSRLFQEHYRFQLDYALPLCYRLGRRLRTAHEVAQLTEGGVDQSEYLLLYNHLTAGTPLPGELGVNPEDIVKSGDRYDDGSYIVDDCDIEIDTHGGSRTIKYRHSLGFSPDTLTNNHMDKSLKLQGNLGMMGLQLAELTMTGRQQEMVYATSSNVGVLSLPGLTDPIQSLDTRALHREVTGDSSKRFALSRGRFVKPALNTVELLDNGNIKHTITTAKILEKSAEIPRMAIFEVCDMQIGSPTARQDFQVKYLSMILEKAREMPVAIHFAGDIIHGNIYANMAYEAQAQGLLRVRSQKLVVEETLRKVFDAAPRPLLDAVIDVLVQQGNHDDVQRIKSFGNANHDSNVDYIEHTMKGIFETPGSEGIVRHAATMLTDSGTPVSTWRGYSHYGPTTVQTAHYHINRGMKGNTGGLPVYHALQRAQGIGSAEQPDIILGAHWHNPQIALVNDVVSVVGGALAERSEFEDMLGYDAKVAGTVIEVGGGEPPTVEFIGSRAMIEHDVKYGYFQQESLRDHGFHDDPFFDAAKHAPYSYDYLPKSALQKAILAMNRRASELTQYETKPRNPNIYDSSGRVISENEVTRRLAERARELAV